jgi:hypothetical protein
MSESDIESAADAVAAMRLRGLLDRITDTEAEGYKTQRDNNVRALEVLRLVRWSRGRARPLGLGHSVALRLTVRDARKQIVGRGPGHWRTVK